MMKVRTQALAPAGLAVLLLLVAVPVSADPLDGAAIDAEPQFYAMSLPSAPVAEVAEEVLGEALGLPVEVSPDVDTEMSFRVEGVYAPRDLAKEFGYRLWNADAVLIDRGAEGLAIIPRSGLADAVARGAEVVSPLADATPAVTTAAEKKHPPIRYGQDRWQARPWALWLVLALGWAGGLATLPLTGLIRRRLAERRKESS